MPRPRYLTKDGKGWKLRRPIPQRLQAFAEADPEWTAVGSNRNFVDRKSVTGKPWAEMCQAARTFGFETDLLLQKWERQRHASEDAEKRVPAIEPRFNFSLSESEAEQIALAYFLDRDRAYSKHGYLVLEDGYSLSDALDDARHDLAQASARLADEKPAEGPDFRFESRRNAVRLLIRYEYIDEADVKPAPPKGNKPVASRRVARRITIPDWLVADPVFQFLCRKIEEANYEIARRCVEALETSAPPTIQNQFFAAMVRPDAAPSPTKKATYTLSQLTAEFQQAKRDEGVSKSRLDQYRIPIRILHEVLGQDTLLEAIDVDACDAIAEALPNIPPNYTKTYPNLSVLEAIAQHEIDNGEKANRRKAALDSLQVIKSIFALGMRKRWIALNPFEDQRIFAADRRQKKHVRAFGGYQPFTGEELKAIFTQPLFTGCRDDSHGYATPSNTIWRRHRYWSYILALWTGARMNELLQLERGDVRDHGDFWYITVTDEEEIDYDPETFEKRLKNPNAVRDIPLHPRLLDYGFVDWAKRVDQGRLFPEALTGTNDKPSILFSKRSSTFLKRAGVWQKRKKVFHSFRGTFNDALRDGGVEPEMRELINGWQRQHDMDAKYGKGHKLERMHEAICKLDCGAFEFDHLLPTVWRQTNVERP